MAVKRVIVTGASGFVGQSVACGFQDFGCEVTGLVRSALLEEKSYVVQAGFDLGSPGDMGALLADTDVVVHCAAKVHSMGASSGDSREVFRKVNVEGTLELARQAAKRGVGRFVFISTVKVNGEITQPGKVFSEDDVPDPSDIYGQSKLEAEKGLLEIARASDLEVVIIRPPLVYGPGVGGNFRQLLKLANTPVPLPFGAMNNRRSMVYVENLVSLIICVAEHPEAANEIFLASDDRSISTTELFSLIRYFLGRKRRLVPVPPGLLLWLGRLAGKGAIVDRLCNSLEVKSEGARKLLGWVPPFSVEEGMRKTAVHFRHSDS